MFFSWYCLLWANNFRHSGDNGGTDEELETEELKRERLDDIMNEAPVPRSKHQDSSAMHINRNTGKRTESGLRVAAGCSEAPLRQTISSDQS